MGEFLICTDFIDKITRKKLFFLNFYPTLDCESLHSSVQKIKNVYPRTRT